MAVAPVDLLRLGCCGWYGYDGLVVFSSLGKTVGFVMKERGISLQEGVLCGFIKCCGQHSLMEGAKQSMMISFPGTCKFLFHCSLVMLLALTPFLTTILTSSLSSDSWPQNTKRPDCTASCLPFFLSFHCTGQTYYPKPNQHSSPQSFDSTCLNHHSHHAGLLLCLLSPFLPPRIWIRCACR